MASSSPIALFIDTTLDTHLSFTVGGDESIAQLKGRIISEHANCFPKLGEISVNAVKAKCGEFFYHISDTTILNSFLRDIEYKLQADIVPVSTTIQRANLTEVNTDACKDKRQHDNIECVNCNSGHSIQFGAKIKKKVSFDISTKDSSDVEHTREKEKEVPSNEDNPLVGDSLQQVITSTKDSGNLKRKRRKKKKLTSNEENRAVNDSEIAFEHGDKSMGKVNDDSNENQTKVDIGAHTEKKLPETDEDMNHNRIYDAAVQPNTNTSMEDPGDLKRKRKKKHKVSSKEELACNPLLEVSSLKVNDTRVDDQPKEVFAKEIISCSNNFENSTLGNVTAEVSQVKDYSLGKKGNEKGHLGIDSESAFQHGDSSMGTVVDVSQKNQTKMDIGAHMEKRPPATDKDLNLDCIQLGTNTSVKDPSDLKRKRKKKKKASSKEELLHNPLLEAPSLKVSDTQAKEVSGKEIISNNNNFENSTLGDATAVVSHVKEYSLEKMGSEEVHLGIDSEVAVEHDDNSMGKVDDILDKNRTKVDIGAHMDQKLPATDEVPVQLDTNTSMKDPSDLRSKRKKKNPSTSTKDPSDLRSKRKKKKKISSKEVLPTNPLPEGSSLKAKEVSAKELISNNNDVENSTLGDSAAEVSQFKESSLDKMGNEKVNPVIDSEHGDSSMGKVDDVIDKSQSKMDIGAHMEKKQPATDEDMNLNCIHEPPVLPNTTTSVKDPCDLKIKRKKKKKVSSNEELRTNPLPKGSSLKVQVDSQPKEVSAKETISNSNDLGNESGVAASIKISSQPSTVQNVESSLKTIGDKRNREEKISEVPPPSKLLNDTSGDLDSCLPESVVPSGGLENFDHTTTSKILEHEHIENKSGKNDPAIQISNDPASQIPEKVTVNEAPPDEHGDGNVVGLDNSIKENAPPQIRRERRVVRKIPMSRIKSGLNNPNKDGSAPPEKANSGTHGKVDSNVGLDNTKKSPDGKGKRAGPVLRDSKGRFVSTKKK